MGWGHYGPRLLWVARGNFIWELYRKVTKILVTTDSARPLQMGDEISSIRRHPLISRDIYTESEPEQQVNSPEAIVEVLPLRSSCGHPSCADSPTCIPYSEILLDVVSIISGRSKE